MKIRSGTSMRQALLKTVKSMRMKRRKRRTYRMKIIIRQLSPAEVQAP